MTTEPDAYLHWPPGFPILLAMVFRTFGESAAAARLTMLLNLLILGGLLYWCVRQATGSMIEAVAAAFCLLTLPVTVTYGSQVWGEPMAVVAIMISAFAAAKSLDESGPSYRWTLIGLSSMIIGITMSWIAGLIPLGMFILAASRRSASAFRLGALWMIVAAGAFAAILALYIWQFPALGNDLWNTIVFRLGVGPYAPSHLSLHTLVNVEHYTNGGGISLPTRIWRVVTQMRFLGQIGMISIIVGAWGAVTDSRSNDANTRFWSCFMIGSLSPWAIWLFLMANHVWHNNLMISASVPAAIALGHVWSGLIENQQSRFARAGLLFALPFVLLLPLMGEINSRIHLPKAPSHEVELGLEVNRAVPSGSIVLTSSHSPVITYYSRRHVIRGIGDDRTVKTWDNAIGNLAPGAAVYLAIERDQAGAFPATLESSHLIRSTRSAIVARISP